MQKYPIPSVVKEQIEKQFTYHPPNPDQPGRYADIRDKARELALLLVASCPPSVELDASMLRLSEVVMHANAAIARHE